MDSGSVEAPPPPPSQGAPPPPPPPPPIGGAKIPTWREQQEAKLPAQQQIQQIQNDQYSNLPPQLMNSMNKDKKPFTYTPLAVGDKGKLDLSQIRSPRMKKRLLANMKEEEEESGAPTSESPCSYEPSPTPPPTSSLDRSQTPDSSKMANKSEVPKIFKVPLPPKIDFTQELLARQREKQTPVNITSTPTAASYTDTNRTPMSPIELENTVDSEILGLHNALNQARPLEDISELINTRVPTIASTHPLADARVPSSFGTSKHVPQSYPNDNGGYESSQYDESPMTGQSNGTTYAPHPPPPPTKRSSNMTTIPIKYENNPYSNQNDTYNSNNNNNNNYNDYLYQPSQPQHQPQNYSSNNQYAPRYDAQPVAPPREYFNIEPPKKIDILREIEKQDPSSYSAPSKVLGPSLGEQWAQKNQRQGQYSYDYSQPNYESYQIPFKSQPAPPPRPQPQPQYEYNPQPMRYNSQPQPQQYRPINVSYDDGERSEPTQSRSFKVLQKLTEGIEDEIQNLKLHEKQMNMQQQQQAAPQKDKNLNWQPTNYGAPRQAAQPSPRPYPRGNSSGYGTSNIPNNSFNYLQDLVTGFESDLNTAVYGNNYQNGQIRSQKENIIPVRLENQSYPSYSNDAYRGEEPPVSSRSYRMVKHKWESTRSVPYGTDF